MLQRVKHPYWQHRVSDMGMSMISAISNQGRVRFEFIEDSAQKVFLILDNLKVRHAKRVTAWLVEHQDDIEVFCLPPYSPEISLDEYLNRDFKTRLRSADRAESKYRSYSKRLQHLWTFWSKRQNG